jgi:hypothetical protein
MLHVRFVLCFIVCLVVYNRLKMKAKKNEQGKFEPKNRIEVDGKFVESMSELRRRKCVIFLDTYFVRRTSGTVCTATYSLNVSGVLARNEVDFMVDVAVNDKPSNPVDEAFAATEDIDDFFSSSPKKQAPTSSEADGGKKKKNEDGNGGSGRKGNAKKLKV